MGPPYGQSDPPGHRIDQPAIPDPRVAGLPGPEPPSPNDPRYWTLRRRLRRAWEAFRDYPGRRVRDGGRDGRLVMCGEPYGCGGSGVLHDVDEPPDREPIEPIPSPLLWARWPWQACGARGQPDSTGRDPSVVACDLRRGHFDAHRAERGMHHVVWTEQTWTELPRPEEG